MWRLQWATSEGKTLVAKIICLDVAHDMPSPILVQMVAYEFLATELEDFSPVDPCFYPLRIVNCRDFTSWAIRTL